jgi:hypothetical protein
MFRSGLLVTTAIVIVGTLSFFAAQSAAAARPLNARTGRDRNNEFLCTYGDIMVSHDHFATSGPSFYLSWTHVAVPIKGRGQTVSQIIVMDALEGSASRLRNEFSAGIYSSTLHGKPGNLIAGNIGSAPTTCGKVVFPITPTTLEKNKTYWVEETADQPNRSNKKIDWAVNPKARQNAYVQHHFSSSYVHSQGFHSSTTKWEKQHSGPWFMLK